MEEEAYAQAKEKTQEDEGKVQVNPTSNPSRIKYGQNSLVKYLFNDTIELLSFCTPKITSFEKLE